MPVRPYTVALLGDTSFGENYQAEYAAAGGANVLESRGYAHSLQPFRSFLKSCDFVIANLETPLTDLERSALHGAKQYVHWSHVERAPAALREHNVHAVSLANNHTLDYGAEGLTQTLASLRRHGIEYFGGGKDSAEADRPFVHEFEVDGRKRKLLLAGAFEVRRKYLLDYRFYADENAPGVSKLRLPDAAQRIERLKRDEPDAFVVVFPHWGQNYMWRTPRQMKLAHALIDAGAGLIVGHGAHMLGEIEAYGGAWIAYSLGNFVFNSEGDYRSRGAPPFSLIATLSFSPESAALRLYPILSDNLATDYQPRFVDQTEFERVFALLVQRSPDGMRLRDSVGLGTDTFGHYLEIAL
jgi:poly-gamma-glutamate capsule biosynthesis protein CapA/YwtB (metallophosphatase superfamily)